MTEIFIYATVFLSTLAGVESFRRWSRRRELFDIPNERSSHTVPTPRGGGLLIVFVCLAAYSFSTIFWTGNFQYGYLLGALLIAVVSWLDDLYTLSFGWRFLVHAVGAGLAMLTLGYFDNLAVPLFGTWHFGVNGIWLTFFWIVWLTNAYNFMDGIDGIAGIQAVTAGIGWFFIGDALGFPVAGFYGGIIAAAALGFLILNWQPAKIFMGDVGSAFLGYSFAVLPLLAKSESGAASEKPFFLLPCAVLAIWLFAFDTLWTFGRRVLRKEKVWEAHRSHLYQRLAIGGFSHRLISSFYGLISGLNVLLLILYLNNRIWETALAVFLVIESGGLLGGVYYFGKKHSK